MSQKIYKLNLRGKKCPIPVLKISKKVKEIFTGDIIEVKTDDPKATYDLDQLSKNIQIKILTQEQKQKYLLTILQKK
tara:strand:+ start:294 stop:524 length:231 start_codon:yes stop_codon:yes gene_type:complete